MNARRGLGRSRQRKQDKFTEYKNMEFLNPYIGGKPTYPSREVTVSTGVIVDLVRNTLNYLRFEVVEIRVADYMMLARVTILQVRAKVAKARATTHVASQPVNDPYVDKTVRHLREVVKSLKFLIDQYGIVKCQKQVFIPRIEAPTDITLPAGKVRTNVRMGDKVLYVPPGYLTNVFDCPADDRSLINEHEIIFDIDATIDEYNNFIDRVRRKSEHSLTTIDFENTKGSLSQLVGSCDDPNRGREYRKTWCSKNVPIQLLVVGGGFKLGYNSQDPFHNMEIRNVESSLNLFAFLDKIQTRPGHFCLN